MTTKILYLNDPNSVSYIIKLISIILFAIIIFVVLMFKRPKSINIRSNSSNTKENILSNLYAGGLITLLSFVITFIYSSSSTTAVIVNVFFSLIIIFSALLSIFVLFKSKIVPEKERSSVEDKDEDEDKHPLYKIIETQNVDKYGNISKKKVYEPIDKKEKIEEPTEKNLTFFQSLINYLIDSKNIILLIIYMIGLIILYSVTPTKYINDYSYIIFPITLFLGFALFFINIYKGNSELKKTFNLNSQVTNYTIIYICLVIFITIFGVTDPGNYIKNHSGIFIFASVLSIIFGLLYLLTFLLPVFNIVKNSFSSKGSNVFSSFTSSSLIFSIFKVILFIGLTITVIVGLVNYPGGINNEKNIKTAVINILLFLSLLNIAILLLKNIFSSSLISYSFKTKKNIDETVSKINNVFKKLLLLVGGFLILRIIIYIVVRFPSFIKEASLGQIILLSFIAIIIISGIFLTLKKLYANSPAANKISSGIFSLFSLFMGALKDLISTPTNYFIVFVVAILCYVTYFSAIPYLQKKVEKQGGNILIERPIYLNNEITLGTYSNLNANANGIFSNFSSNSKVYEKLPPINYNYAISFWIFLDAFGPSINSSYNKYTSILNYGGNPNIKYNAKENTLIITMKKNGIMPTRESNFRKNNEDNEEEIVYKRENMLLQKWTHVIINYNGGTLDIFIDGELVKSQGEVIPYMNTDTLVVGTNNGLNSGICNLVYFSKNLNSTQIYNLYNFQKKQLGHY